MADNGGTDLYARIFVGTDQTKTPSDEVVRLNDSDDAEERAQQVLRNLASAEVAFNAFLGPAKEEQRFYHGSQWDDVDRMRMETSKRPAITINQIRPAVDAISGLERLNRSDVRIMSRALDSAVQVDAAGDLASEALTAADDLCNGAEELSRVAKDAVVTGMGWGEVRTDYQEDINGRVVYERVPWEEMRWDPNNQNKENLELREWCARKKPLSRRQFKRMFGEDKLAAVDLATPDMPYGQTDRYEQVTPYYSRANQQANPQVGGGVPKKDIVVIQYQWRDMQPLYRFIDDNTGEEQQFDEEQWKRLTKRADLLGAMPPAAVEQQQPVYRQSFYCRGVELEDPVDLPGGFSFLCMTGTWDDDKKRWYGMVRNMVSPQQVQNKALSTSLAFHISNAKGGLLFRAKAFDDPRRAQDAWSQMDAWIPVSDDADIQKDIVPRTPTQLPPELPMFYSEAQKAITLVSGVNPEMIGQATQQTPSQTAQGRVQAGLVVLGGFFDNLKRHHREKATVMLEFIREYWSQGQLLQVGGDFNSQSMPLFKESLPDRWAYTMVLDDSIRHNPNLKAQIWRDMMDSGVLQALMKFGMGQVILQLLKFSPFPTQLVQQIQKAGMAAAQNPQPQGKGRQPQGKPPAPGKPPEAPEMVRAKVALHSAQAQKAMAQAREIDQRSKMQVPKLALEAMAQGHNQALDRQKEEHVQAVHHGHTKHMDVANTLLKGISAMRPQQPPQGAPPNGVPPQDGQQQQQPPQQ